MDKIIDDYKRMLDTYRLELEKEHGKYLGFAYDGPIDSKKWFSNNSGIKILVLLKETYGYEDCDICQIMDDQSDRFKDSRTNRAISRLAYALLKASSMADSNNNFISDENLFELLDPIHDGIETVKEIDLKISYSNIAILEVKKISGQIKSDDNDIRIHSRENAEFLSNQIRFLNPNIIVCGGQVTWESLTQDMKVFEKGAFASNEKGIYKSQGVVVYNAYHPSSTMFNRYDILFDICKEKQQNSR